MKVISLNGQDDGDETNGETRRIRRDERETRTRRDDDRALEDDGDHKKPVSGSGGDWTGTAELCVCLVCEIAWMNVTALQRPPAYFIS